MSLDLSPPTELQDVFGLVASDVRIQVLVELWEAYPDGLAFSEIRTRVDAADSGTFNYHLNQLRPEFVRKVEDTYRLRYAGRQIVGAAVSGRFNGADTDEIGPVPAGDCIHCEATIEARYDDGVVVVDCPECEELMTKMPIPPVVVASIGPESLPDVFSKHVLSRAEQLARGFCAHCHGHVDASLTVNEDEGEDSVTFRPELDVRFECRECAAKPRLNVGAVLMDHPAVSAFLFDVGIDLRDTYVWELVELLDPEATVASEDPLELDLVFEIDGEVLELTVDETVSVLGHERIIEPSGSE